MHWSMSQDGRNPHTLTTTWLVSVFNTIKERVTIRHGKNSCHYQRSTTHKFRYHIRNINKTTIIYQSQWDILCVLEEAMPELCIYETKCTANDPFMFSFSRVKVATQITWLVYHPSSFITKSFCTQSADKYACTCICKWWWAINVCIYTYVLNYAWADMIVYLHVLGFRTSHMPLFLVIIETVHFLNFLVYLKINK
jgi:hypothetical protein